MVRGGKKPHQSYTLNWVHKRPPAIFPALFIVKKVVLEDCVCFSRPSLLFPISQRWEASTAKHIMEKNKHTADGKHMWRRWNDLPRVNTMKYTLASCWGPIVALRSRCGGELEDPRRTLTLYTQAANMAILKQIHAETRVWQWHLHSLLNSFCLPNMHGQTHTQRARGHGRRRSTGA